MERDIISQNLIQPGCTVLVAVSGGSDSIVLLDLLNRLAPSWRLKLAVAHVNHGFRGKESDEEERFVMSLADRLGLICKIGRFQLPRFIEKKRLNAQVAARHIRYEFLVKAAIEVGAQSIALAHHADDQAETLLMRMIRGTSVSGLSGIPVSRMENGVELIRPLLRIYKTEIETHLKQYQLDYCEDSSNRSRKYFRNQVRLDIVPFLKNYNRLLAQSLNRLAITAGEEEDYLINQAKQTVEALCKFTPESVEIQRGSFQALHVALQRRSIKLILDYVWQEPFNDFVDFSAIIQVCKAINQEDKPNLTLHLPNGVMFVREYEYILIKRKHSQSSQFTYEIDEFEAEMLLPESGIKLLTVINHISITENWIMTSPWEVLFDLDQLVFPLTIRSRQAGDRIEPFGFNGSKKVKDLLVDIKMPPSNRQTTPILLDRNSRILWLPGVRRSRHAPVDNKTTRVLYIQALPIVSFP